MGVRAGSAPALRSPRTVSLLTARHVVDGFLRDYQQEIAAGQAGLIVIAETDVHLGVEEDGTPKYLGSVLNVVRADCHAHTDIALLRVLLPATSAGSLLNPLVVDVTPPAAGDQCLAIGYKHCSLSGTISPDHLSSADYERQLVISRGTVDEIYLQQRSEWQWDFPCFVTDAKYNGGMSGCPVILPDGRIHGLVSSSDFPDEGPVAVGATSHVTLLAGALAFHVDGRRDESDLLAHVLQRLAGDDLGLGSVDVYEATVEPSLSLDDLFSGADTSARQQLKMRYRTTAAG